MTDTQRATTRGAKQAPRIVGVNRVEIDRAAQVLLRLSGDGRDPPMDHIFAESVVAESSLELAFVLAGMASSAVSELAGLLSMDESAVVDVLRARLLVVYAREG
ncbi:hypothetical protein [Aeromicrobium sp. CnD17-E]|uniref:hypothetical protein n=1 Tax=Aeromicrobium sp. CnD17-E TaxID=2954487 RepID=UPI00209766A8|nr:hypothetical protein [Aeromicrobium sp. CnD17-E]MCO7238697.1 hypothetical protein [Aeromicrobium sp. CnD17-E]